VCDAEAWPEQRRVGSPQQGTGGFGLEQDNLERSTEGKPTEDWAGIGGCIIVVLPGRWVPGSVWFELVGRRGARATRGWSSGVRNSLEGSSQGNRGVGQ
jgi:hypothetical protein